MTKVDEIVVEARASVQDFKQKMGEARRSMEETQDKQEEFERSEASPQARRGGRGRSLAAGAVGGMMTQGPMGRIMGQLTTLALAPLLLAALPSILRLVQSGKLQEGIKKGVEVGEETAGALESAAKAERGEKQPTAKDVLTAAAVTGTTGAAIGSVFPGVGTAAAGVVSAPIGAVDVASEVPPGQFARGAQNLAEQAKQETGSTLQDWMNRGQNMTSMDPDTTMKQGLQERILQHHNQHPGGGG